MQAMKKPLIFLHSHIREDFGILEANLKGAIRYFKSVNESEGTERYGMQEALRSIKDEEFKSIKKIMGILKGYKESINSDCYIPLGEERMDSINSTLNYSMMIPFQKIKELLAFLRECSIDEVQSNFKFMRVKKGLREYISRVLEQEPDKQNIHVVLESAPHAEKYFHRYFKEIRKSMSMYGLCSGKEYQISTITSNNYYSLAAFLHASDFPEDKVETEIWKLQDLISVSLDTQEKFDSNHWCKLKKLRIRELEEEVWRKRDVMFDLVEKELNEGYGSGLPMNEMQADIRRLQERLATEVEHQKDRINEAMQKSLYFIIDEISSISCKVRDADLSSEEFINRIAKQLSLHLK